MDEFLIYLAQNANMSRFGTLPPGYSDSKEDLERLSHHLHNIDQFPELKTFITSANINMSYHGKNSINLHITEYEFKYSYIEEATRDLKYPKRWFMYHGSPLGNWHNILRTGIKNLSGTNWMTTGQVLGPGVYMANDIKTAYTYGKSNKDACIAVLEILTDPTPYSKNNGIYVIPDDSLIVARYLFKIDKYPVYDGKDILEFYKRLSDNRLKQNNIPIKREIKEKALLTIIHEIPNYLWVVIYEGIQYRIYLRNFPFKAPLIQLAYKLVDGIQSNHLFIDSNDLFNNLFDKNGFYKLLTDWSPANNIALILDEINKKITSITPLISTTMTEYEQLTINTQV